MKTISLVFSLFFSTSFFLFSHEPPKQEVRAAWLTTIYGLDWPSCPATNEKACQMQKQEVCDILDQLQEANFNTIFIQARLRGDVIYKSEIEPASKVFSGKYGSLPGYDPLSFVIDECHKRGMECHAFFVTFPVGSAKVVKEQGKLSVVNKYPDLCLFHKGEWYLDPGLPGTSDYILSLVKEIIRNYDLDGIQFDYIRYPNEAKVFPDKKSYATYGKGKKLDDWRRDNINQLMTRVHDWIKQEKPWIQVSSATLGKYSKIPENPNAGWTAFDDVYQDPKAWLLNEKQDMIVPMMYYQQNDFYPFINNWKEHSNQRNMVVGLGVYRLSKKEGDWNISEIKDQINYSRNHGVNGFAFFRTKYVVDNEKGLYNELKNNYFKYPAQLPPLTWLCDSIPESPQEITVKREGNQLKLSWSHYKELNKNHSYTIYYSESDSIDFKKAQSILATGIRNSEFFLPINVHSEKFFTFCITTSNRYRIESKPSNEVCYYLCEFEK